MRRINLIVAIDENRGIGKHNQLLCHLPADLKHFKTMTLGKPVIMGRKTFDSIGKPLPGRVNIVLSKQALSIQGVTVVHSLEEALQLTKNADEVMIIGGAKIFQEALPLADGVYLTLIHHTFAADVFFPTLDEGAWSPHLLGCFLQDDKNKHDMTFYYYERRENLKKHKINEKSV
jgi:dihydrofolate reductase